MTTRQVTTVVHPAMTRGHVDHGWLDSHHTFSFGTYYHPERTHFGALRVLNDDVVQGGSGFGPHAHENMEIISIPLQGALTHQDNAGHAHVLQRDEVQVMSAGTGITHAEYNQSVDTPVHFLQIWIVPEVQHVTPRYAQQCFDPQVWANRFFTIVGPQPRQDGLWIYQQAFIARAHITAGSTVRYEVQQPGHGVYVFVVEGSVSVFGNVLEKRDGMGVEGATHLIFQSIAMSDVLLFEVPMSSKLR